jgi:glutarate dioxygenase
MDTLQSNKGHFLQKHASFEVTAHPQHERLYQINLNQDLLKKFFNATTDTDIQRLSYVAFERFYLSSVFLNFFGESFAKTLTSILNDRESGGFTTSVNGVTDCKDDYIKFATALTHITGSPIFDAMSGNYFATFAIENKDNSDTYLRQAYKIMTLHTDGAYEEEIVEWILMMKMEERNTVGGNSRLLHLDDWADIEKFSSHPLAFQKVKRQGAKSKNMSTPQFRPTFFWKNGQPCICFAEQNIKPDSIEQGVYFKEIAQSLESSSSIVSLELPVGELVMVNNLYWLHGRDAFASQDGLYRELMRQRGYFHHKL